MSKQPTNQGREHYLWQYSWPRMSAVVQQLHDIPYLKYIDGQTRVSGNNIDNWTNVWSHDHPTKSSQYFSSVHTAQIRVTIKK